jgi:hypothetical protein
MTSTTGEGRGNASTSLLAVSGTRLVQADGSPVVLKGVGLGGWMNMENFITGYPGTESSGVPSNPEDAQRWAGPLTAGSVVLDPTECSGCP